MKKALGRLWPASLKNRLFISIALLVLVPSFLLQVYHIGRMEDLMKGNISSQNAAQLDSIKGGFERVRLSVVGSMLQLEREPEVSERLLHPERYEEEERGFYLKNRLFTAVQNLAGNASVPVHIVLADKHGNVYTTFPESLEASAQSRALEESDFRRLIASREPYFWEVHEADDWLGSVFQHPFAYSHFSRLEAPDGEVIAYLRISLDVNAWLSNVTNSFQVKQSYYVMNGAGESVPLTAGRLDNREQLQGMLAVFRERPQDYFTDSGGLYLYNGIYLPNTDWYLISRFPLEVLSGNIDSMLKQAVLVLGVAAALFVVITFGLVSALVKPLRHLQTQMTGLVANNLEVKLPEHKYKGEVLTLAQAFNQMIQDIQGLIGRLRSEERQREASRFQMLMAQMNPHFLLNTLNTIKWNARNHGDHGTSEICQNLGMLLERSLNATEDLVYLKEEIGLVKAYLHIQSFRYEHSFDAVYELEEGLDYALVPKLSLQPLVENCINHGLVHMKDNGKIMVRALKREGLLCLEIQDNGRGLHGDKPKETRRRKGIGLENLRERLALLYKGQGALHLLPLEQGTLARLDIPLLLSSPYKKEGDGNHVDHIAGRG